MCAWKLLAIVIIGTTAVHSTTALNSLCKPMQADVCKELSNEYNHTFFPNDFFTSQARALTQFALFDTLVESKCSSVLTKFLCTYHFPPCSPQFTPQHVWPCRSLCEMARRDCEPVLNQYGHVWPKYFNCSEFPAHQPCVNNTISTPAPDTPIPTSDTISSTISPSTPSPSPITDTPTITLSLGEKCVKINSTVCASLHPEYVTYFPHKNYVYQELAVLQFNSFQLLLQSNCSEKLELFLCTSHFPACVESSQHSSLQLIYPCKHLCKQVRRSCGPVLTEHGLPWPEHLNCDNFPSKNDNFCADSTFLSMMPQPTTTTPTSSVLPQPSTKPSEVTSVEGCQPLNPRVQEICGVLHETYTHTNFPHGRFKDQNTAYDEFVSFLPFIESNCSAELRAFLCYEYFPACSPENPDTLIKPCRSVCRKALAGCQHCLEHHSIQLPSCDQYKVKGSCMSLANLKSYLRSAVSTTQCPISELVTTVTPSQTPAASECEECRIKELTKKALQNNYDYVVKVRVLISEAFSPKAIYYSVEVKEYFYPFTPPTNNTVLIVHTQSGEDCPCISLKVNKEYLIAGYYKNGGILFLPNNGALIRKWNDVDYSNVKQLVTESYSN